MQRLRNGFLRGFTSLELLTFFYAIFTAVYILCFYVSIQKPAELLLYRFAVVGAIIFFKFLYTKKPVKIIELIRFAFPLVMIMYWYPETYYLTHGLDGQAVLIPNLDGFFDDLDRKLFGCTPAMDFSAALPYRWFSEIMYFSYFFYYVIYAYIAFYFFFCDRKNAYQTLFTVLMSFFVFYIIFVFIPVEGPQFFWTGADIYVPEGYIFSKIQRGLQAMGEMPTGAFPSSHVGLTLIYMIILFKYKRNMFWIFLPVAILLCMSTVYIKAHYLIDVVASFIITPFIYLLAVNTYKAFKKKFPAMDEIG